MTNKQIAKQYIQALATHNIDKARAFLADTYSFQGPFGRIDGADDFMESFSRMIPMISAMDTEDIIASGQNVVAISDLKTQVQGMESTRIAEWFTVENHKITSSRLYFDTVKWREIMT